MKRKNHHLPRNNLEEDDAAIWKLDHRKNQRENNFPTYSATSDNTKTSSFPFLTRKKKKQQTKQLPHNIIRKNKKKITSR